VVDEFFMIICRMFQFLRFHLNKDSEPQIVQILTKTTYLLCCGN